jgi:hypothetical protein
LETPPTPLNRVRPDVSDGLAVVVDTMLAKSRQDRYPTPSDLVFDLQCLLAGQPPRLAQERVSLRTLADLAEGEPVEDRGSMRVRGRHVKHAPASGGGWTVVATTLLIISILVNVALILTWR